MERIAQRYHSLTFALARPKAWLILAFGMLVGCQTDKTRLSGYFADLNADYLIINQLLPEGIRTSDTMALAGGRFMHTLRGEGVKIYLIPINDTLLLPFIAQPGDRLRLTAQGPDFDRTYRVEGNEESRLLLELRQTLTRFDDTLKPLSQFLRRHQNADSLLRLSDSLHAVYETHFQRHRAYLTDFINTNPDKLASLTAFYQTLGRRAFFDPVEDIQLMEKLFENLRRAYPESEYVQQLEISIADARQKRTLSTGN
jgi:hypothetical protein